MVQAHAAAAAVKRQLEGEDKDGLSFPTSTPRLRVDLQLDDLAALDGEWGRAVSHRYLPFYEKARFLGECGCGSWEKCVLEGYSRKTKLTKLSPSQLLPTPHRCC